MVYRTEDFGITWLPCGETPPPGLVDICHASLSFAALAVGITASGEVWAAHPSVCDWAYSSTVGGGTDFVSIGHFFLGTEYPNGVLFAMTACGDVYYNIDLSTPDWSYRGNVFGNPPSQAESETWGELKEQWSK